VPYLSALEMCSRQGAIQIHVDLTLSQIQGEVSRGVNVPEPFASDWLVTAGGNRPTPAVLPVMSSCGCISNSLAYRPFSSEFIRRFINDFIGFSCNTLGLPFSALSIVCCVMTFYLLFTNSNTVLTAACLCFSTDWLIAHQQATCLPTRSDS